MTELPPYNTRIPMPKLTFLVDGQSHDVPPARASSTSAKRTTCRTISACTVGSCGNVSAGDRTGRRQRQRSDADELENDEMSPASRRALGCQLVIKGDIAIRPVD